MLRMCFLVTAVIASAAFADEEPGQSGCFFLDRECISKEKIKQRRAEADSRETARREKYLADKAEQEAAYSEQVRQKVEQARLANEESAERKRTKAAAERQASDLKYQQYVAERERKQAEMAKAQEAEERAERLAQKKREAEVAEKKARCGSDFNTPSIGMRIERVQECLAPAKLVSQINRADGVVSTYRSGSLTFHVMSGRVIAWDRY